MYETQKEPVVVINQNQKWMKDHPIGSLWIIGFGVLSIGLFLTVLIITAVIGIPMMVIGLAILVLALILTLLKPFTKKKNKQG